MDSTDIESSKKKVEDISKWVELYTRDLLSWAFRKTSDKMLAEDLVQQVFLIATEQYASFKGDSTPKTWLFAILKNKIAEHYRKLSARPKVDSMESPFFNESDDWKEENRPKVWAKADEGSLLDNQEFKEVWQHCIHRLPELQSACIRLKFIAGTGSKEICQDLNISLANYWQLLHRAKLQLRVCLEKLWFSR